MEVLRDDECYYLVRRWASTSREQPSPPTRVLRRYFLINQIKLFRRLKLPTALYLDQLNALK